MDNKTFDTILREALHKYFNLSVTSNKVYTLNGYSEDALTYQIFLDNKQLNTGEYVWHISSIFGKRQMYPGPGLNINLSQIPNDPKLIREAILDYCIHVLECGNKYNKLETIAKRKKEIIKDFTPDSLQIST